MNWQGNIQPDHHIEHAFTCGDTPYFCFTDSFNIPCERAMDALHVYQEFKNRTDDVYLKAFCVAKQNLYKKNPINIFELKKLDDQLQERLELALPPPRIVKNLASVYYFDESENPYTFDRAYAEKKIKKWETEKIIDTDGADRSGDFFLSKVINDLIPSSTLPDDTLAQYSKIAEMIDQSQLKEIYSHLSSAQRSNSSFKHRLFTNIGEKITV